MYSWFQPCVMVILAIDIVLLITLSIIFVLHLLIIDMSYNQHLIIWASLLYVACGIVSIVVGAYAIRTHRRRYFLPYIVYSVSKVTTNLHIYNQKWCTDHFDNFCIDHGCTHSVVSYHRLRHEPVSNRRR